MLNMGNKLHNQNFQVEVPSNEIKQTKNVQKLNIYSGVAALLSEVYSSNCILRITFNISTNGKCLETQIFTDFKVIPTEDAFPLGLPDP